jgi:hypothetical protein
MPSEVQCEGPTLSRYGATGVAAVVTDGVVGVRVLPLEILAGGADDAEAFAREISQPRTRSIGGTSTCRPNPSRAVPLCRCEQSVQPEGLALYPARSVPGNGEVAIYLAFARGTRSPPSRPPSGNGWAEEANDRLNDTPEHVPRQHRGLARDEVVTRGEQLARAGVADDAQRPGRKCRVIQFDGPCVPVWLARDLTEDLSAPTGIGKHHRRPQFGLRQIGKRESDENDSAYCR